MILRNRLFNKQIQKFYKPSTCFSFLRNKSSGGGLQFYTTTTTTTTINKSSLPCDNSLNSQCSSCNSTVAASILKPSPPPPSTVPPSTEKPVTSFYKRNLPSHLIEFSSDEGKKLFKQSLEAGYMEGYFALAEQFVSQSDPAYCGLATLAMVLNSLKIDPKRLWKGPWRWFAEDMLDCCVPTESVKKRGITFTEFACLSKCNGAQVRSFRADESSITEFREYIKEACSKGGFQHLVMSYSRKVLGQTGSGHYSPVGGYNPEKDLALVLDVARFKYSPHWVPVQVLWEAMTALDKDTGRPRGFYMMSTDHLYTPSFCRVKNTLSWSSLADKYMATLPKLLESSCSTCTNEKDIIRVIFNNLPQETSYVLCAFSHELHKRLTSPGSSLSWEEFFYEITRSPSYEILKSMLEENEITNWRVTHQHEHSTTSNEICHDYPVHLAALMFLSLPSHLFNNLSFSTREKLSLIRNLDFLHIQVINEIMKIRDEMFKVSQSLCECTDQQQNCIAK